MYTSAWPRLPPSHAHATTHIARQMEHALSAANRSVPRYLQALAVERDVSEHKRWAFAMFGYWVGEYELGKIAGAISTEAGGLEGREVTLVNYDGDPPALPELIEKVLEAKYAQKVLRRRNKNTTSSRVAHAGCGGDAK